MSNQPFLRRFGAKRVAVSVSLLAAGAVAGGILAGTLTANAASGSSGTSGAGGAPAMAPQGPGMFRHGGAAPVRSDERALTGSVAAKVRAAALKAVPGATVYRVETDAGDGTYEAHLTKADGTLVTVKLDKAITHPHVETGMGQGDPAAGAPPMR